MTKSLAPMPEPQRAVGYKVTRLRDGKEDIATLVAQTTDTQTWTDSTGCRYVLLRTGFAPVSEFSACEGNTGYAEGDVAARHAVPSAPSEASGRIPTRARTRGGISGRASETAQSRE